MATALGTTAVAAAAAGRQEQEPCQMKISAHLMIS
jgi:hypothetical protein